MRVIPPIKRRKSSAGGSARVGIGLRGRIKQAICLPNESDPLNPTVIREYEWEFNTILDCGLDHCFNYVFADCFTHGHLSTDTATPATTDTSMSGWVKESDSYGSGDGSTSWSGDVYTLQRSFVFDEETSDQTYTKFYSSPESGSDAVPFNELLLALPITVSAGQQAKITMALDLTITPHMTAKTYSSEVISTSEDGSTKLAGSTGKFGIISFLSYANYGSRWICTHLTLSGIKSNGSTGSIGGDNTPATVITEAKYSPLLEPSSASNGTETYQGMAVYDDWGLIYEAYDDETTALPIKSSPGGIWSTSISTYVPGTFTRTKSWFANLNYCNSSNIESVGLFTRYAECPCAQFLLDTPFSKTNLQQFTFNLVFTLSRS